MVVSKDEIAEALMFSPSLPEPTESEVEDMEIRSKIQNCLNKILIIDYIQYHKGIWICPSCRTLNQLDYIGQINTCRCGSTFEVHLISSAPNNRR